MRCAALQTHGMMTGMKTALCRFCGSPIKRKTKWQEFCSSTCRWRSWSSSHPHVRKDAELPAEACFYCGLPGIGVDHVPPMSFRMRIQDLGLIGRFDFCEVRCCSECNSALGARALFRLAERKRFIKSWIRKRYGTILRTPHWSDDEIRELGYNLSTMVISRSLMAEVIEARLKW